MHVTTSVPPYSKNARVRITEATISREHATLNIERTAYDTSSGDSISETTALYLSVAQLETLERCIGAFLQERERILDAAIESAQEQCSTPEDAENDAYEETLKALRQFNDAGTLQHTMTQDEMEAIAAKAGDKARDAETAKFDAVLAQRPSAEITMSFVGSREM